MMKWCIDDYTQKKFKIFFVHFLEYDVQKFNVPKIVDQKFNAVSLILIGICDCKLKLINIQCVFYVYILSKHLWIQKLFNLIGKI